jgi:hypothetical protein
LNKQFNALSFSLPYRRLVVKASEMNHSQSIAYEWIEPSLMGLSKLKGSILTNGKLDLSFVEEINVEGGVVELLFVKDLGEKCKNCRKLSLPSLGRFGLFDFSVFPQLKSLIINDMDYADELKFGPLEHLSIRSKYEAFDGGRRMWMDITRETCQVSKHIEAIKTLKTLELSDEFFVSASVLSKLQSYTINPKSKLQETLYFDAPDGSTFSMPASEAEFFNYVDNNVATQ